MGSTRAVFKGEVKLVYLVKSLQCVLFIALNSGNCNMIVVLVDVSKPVGYC